jgi:protein SCO1
VANGSWFTSDIRYVPIHAPTALDEIASAIETLGLDGDKLQPLFITVDPDHDTPEVMSNYVRLFEPRIVGLTGSAKQIEIVAQEYGAYYVRRRTGPDADDYEFDHSSYLYVMDPQGRFVRGFDADTPGDQLAGKLRELMKQVDKP